MTKHSKPAKHNSLPFVTVCTPTFNRRPFVPMMLSCFENQTYPKDKIEWIIIDDGIDKIEDLVCHIPQVKYIKYDYKLTLGKKRNIANELATGDIIVYMDDDDYYPPERIEHAVNALLNNPKALCAGSSAMYIYFKHINKMYQFGPYGPNHATAATFAFKKELLKRTKFNETASVAEEKHFLINYTIPFVQLEPQKSILVFSHIHNSFDKKELLKTLPNSTIHEVNITPADIIKEPNILKFFLKDIDRLLNDYEIGEIKHKPDVLKQIEEIKEKRENIIKEQEQKQQLMQLFSNPQILQNKLFELTKENNDLKEKNKYLEDKIKQLITSQIQQKKPI